MHYAAEYGHIEVFKSLFSRDEIDVNIQDREGKTPLHYAAEYGRVEVVESLLSRGGIDINVRMKREKLPYIMLLVVIVLR
nr:ankyrin repeat domain-containing protein [Wolbachia endosymbiont of Ctenocephalides felis wCfeT]